MAALAVADLGFGLAEELGGERTLDEMVVGAWEALTARRSAACPLCEGELTPGHRVDGHAFGGSCRDCGAQLS